MSNTTINTCSGSFYDSGGFASAYDSDETLSMTICSDGSEGSHIGLMFNELDISPGDLLCFYDGAGTNANQINCILDFSLEAPFMVQASDDNTSGCLTITFNSNNTFEGQGWGASIICSNPCQPVIASLDSTNPPSIPMDDGWIDICPGDVVQFSASGSYPDNGSSYAQSDNTSTFKWNFGDGATGEGRNVSHQFTEPGGYTVRMSITDANGCGNTNFIEQRVRVAPPPTITFSEDLITEICVDEQLMITSDIFNSNSDVQVTTTETSFTFEPSNSEILFIPDGLDAYETAIQLYDFAPGQTLNSLDDLESICLLMEHSYLFDLGITITCPSGNSVTLQNFEGFVPFKYVLGEPVQNLDDPCVSTDIGEGVGYNYCFAQNASNGTLSAEALALMEGDTLPAGTYLPFEQFTDLLGCPLNGEWTISVTDNLPCDNGWIFEWDINFNPNIYPELETFEPTIDSWEWIDDINITNSIPNSMVAQPDAAGTAHFVFQVTDEFGCTHTGFHDVNVLPSTNPECYECTGELLNMSDFVICEGDSVNLDAVFVGEMNTTESFRNTPKEPISSTNYDPSNPYESTVTVTDIFPTTISNPSVDIASVCINMQTDATQDIEFILTTPSGESMTLVSGVGGSGDDFINTCFTPQAISNITAGNAPFTGEFLPQQSWNILNGADVLGTWTLSVSDDSGATFGNFEDWTITFNVQNGISYDWSNAGSLSCNDCSNPTATPTVTTTYVVETSDVFGCMLADTVTVEVVEIFDDINLFITDMVNGTVFYEWDNMGANVNYLISINGGAFEDVGMQTSGQIDGFADGDLVTIQVQPYTVPESCTHPISEVSAVYDPCFLAFYEDVLTMPSCFGASDGSASVQILNGEAPFTFSLNGGTFESLTSFPNLASGFYDITARDGRSCERTVTIEITDPPAIIIDFEVTEASCPGRTDGALEAIPSGGTGEYVSFDWELNYSTALIEDVTEGFYTLTVTDSDGCTASATGEVTAPDGIDVNVTATDAECFGGANGSASLFVSGGLSPYTYEWPANTNGSGPIVSELTANTYFVTVNDMNGCEGIGRIEIDQPAPAIAEINITEVSCWGGSDGTATIEQNGTAPFSYVWQHDNLTVTTQTATGLAVGSYSATMTDAEGCQSIGFTQMTSAPEIILVTDNIPTRCVGTNDGTAIVLASGGVGDYMYQWDNMQTDSAATNLAPGNYQVTVSDGNNCSQETNVSVIEASPIALSTTNTATSCAANNDGTASVMAMGGTGTYTYTWNDPLTQNNNIAENLFNGVYTVTVEDSNQCTALETVTVISEDTIEIATFEVDPVQCFGESNATATVFATNGDGPYSYLWSDPNGQVLPTAINLSADPNLSVTVTDVNNCSVVGTVEILQPDILDVVLDPQRVNCFGDSTGVITANANGGTTPYTYAWDDPNDQATPQATDLFAGQYEVTISDLNGCTTVENTEVTQPQTAITTNITQTFLGCYNGNTSEAIIEISGGSPDYTIIWDSDNEGTNAENLQGGWEYVTIVDSFACQKMDSIFIEELDEIIPNIAFVPPTCYGELDGQIGVNFIEGGVGAGVVNDYEYQWNTIPVQVGPIAVGLGGDQSYDLTVTDAQGCTSLAETFMTQPDIIEVETIETDISCFGLEDGSLQIIENDSTNYTFEWSPNVGIQTGTMIESLDEGTYILTVTDQDECSIVASYFITEPNPLAIDIDSLDNKCYEGTTGSARASVFGGTSPYFYEWSDSNTSDSSVASQLSAGVYYLTIEDNNGCVETDSVVINQPPELLGFTEVTPLGCFGGRDAVIEVESAGGTAPYEYSLNESAFGSNQTLMNLGEGDYPIEIMDDNGCLWETVVKIDPPAIFELDLDANITIEIGDSIQLDLEFDNEVGTPDVEWTSAAESTMSCTTCPNPTVSPLITTTYSVYAVDEKGCEDSDYIRVVVEKNPEVLVPTGFTPNGDGLNDLLYVHGRTESIEQVNYFRIYDRWGEQVYEYQNFELNDLNIGWDGTFRGKELTTDVYVWYIEVVFLDGEKRLYKGETTLFR